MYLILLRGRLIFMFLLFIIYRNYNYRSCTESLYDILIVTHFVYSLLNIYSILMNGLYIIL